MKYPRALTPLGFLISALTTTPLMGQGDVIPIAQEFDRLHFRSIGPAIMSGRVADIAVYENNPAIYYVGTAHGGVWKTTSNGTMFTPLFQDAGLLSIGAVAVSQNNPDLVWVGTGESNNRQSTSWGDGIYKSIDGGRTFQFMGLPNSKHINRIVIDPTNSDVVLVAATGPLFGSGGERGVYKTVDGGKSWKQVLKVDDDTGANDLVVSRTDPKVLFASTYQRRRTSCCVNGGGPGSGIWKSVNGGDTWTRLTGGLPTGSLGRIGLDVYRKSSNIVYASIEGPSAAGGRGAPAEGADSAADAGAGAGRGGGGRGGAGGAAAAGSTGLYRSDDGGESWRKVSNTNPRPLYFSQVRIDPETPDRVYMGGVGLQLTHDGGRTFETDAALVIHDDIHAIWIDPKNSQHVLIGGDGGVAISYDQARTWVALANLPVGLFYHVGFDLETPFNVCGGMQDNYDWCGPSATRFSRGILNSDWFQIAGGDGFVAIPDLRDSRWVYTETQDGSILRRNKVTGESKSIRPSATNVSPTPAAGESFRFHWDTPMILSPNDPGTLLVAANRVFKSTDRGDSWAAISPDLTTNSNRNDIVTMGLKNSETTIGKNDGIVAWSTIVALAESPKQPGVYYAGSDDGVVSVSRDGGKTWQNITGKIPGFPAGAFVSKVVPSRFEAGTVYITVDNHRLNDYAPHMWVSNDFGNTFRSLVGNIKGENIRTLTEDLRNADVLYVGTESGIFLTLDRGKSWRRLKANFPNVRVDEITLHPRDNAMLVASHGRSLWILDHLEPIQEYQAAQFGNADATLLSVPNALLWKGKDDQNDEFWGHQYFIGENPPTDAVISFFVKKSIDDLKLRITDVAGNQVRDLPIPANRVNPGIQTVCWDMHYDGITTPPADSAAAPAGRGGIGGAGGGGAGGAGAGRGGAGGRGGTGPTPVPAAGYLPANPCAGGGGGGGGRGGGGAGAGGPYVLPGTYQVALMAGSKTLNTKPIKVTGDPALQWSDAQMKRYQEIVMDLHGMHQRATDAAAALTRMAPQMMAAEAKLAADTKVPAAIAAQFKSLTAEFETARSKFGVAANAGAAGGRGGAAAPAGGRGGGGGGGRGGAATDSLNVLARAGTVKGAIMAIWELPSATLMMQYTKVKADLPRAIAEANAFLQRASAMNGALKAYGVTFTVPGGVK